MLPQYPIRIIQLLLLVMSFNRDETDAHLPTERTEERIEEHLPTIKELISMSNYNNNSNSHNSNNSSSISNRIAGNNMPSARPLTNIIRIGDGTIVTEEAVEESLVTIHDIATENLGTLCVSTAYRLLQVPINSERYESSRQKVDLVASILQEVGIIRHGGLSDALAKGLLSDEFTAAARILALNLTNGFIQSYVWWMKRPINRTVEFVRYEEEDLQIGRRPSLAYPWFVEEDFSSVLRSPKFTSNLPNKHYKGLWTFPYFSCSVNKWLLSYSIAIPPIHRHGLRGFVSIDIDVTDLRVNQCDGPIYRFNYHQTRPADLQLTDILIASDTISDVQAFHKSHKCHPKTMTCDYRLPSSESPTTANKIIAISNVWSRGAYQCLCKPGFYSKRHPDGFNGTIMEIAWREQRDNISNYYSDIFICLKCAIGCDSCTGPEPCLADYNWPFRISLLTISLACAVGTILLAAYLFHHRKMKVFKVASPIFLLITLIGSAVMYLEMVAIFPYLSISWCIATKWTRHMGFCITYTSLLMKTWRVSLTYRVKSAHKVKLTDQQLLQWMIPILLVMLIYLGTWTISDTPYAEFIHDQNGLKFKQCSYNWWDHSLAIGEVFFLAWGIRVCYNVRHAESLYNEARLISYAIYNIAVVNITMAAIHLFIFPEAGPDIKYALGFARIQLSTTTTIVLVFGPKISRVLRGQGDKWDQKAKVRTITASFSLNGVGLVPEESPDLYQENEELKEQIQKLAHQMEFMKTVHMQINNRHLKPKPGGYFTVTSTSFQAPFNKANVTTAQTQTQNLSQSNLRSISNEEKSIKSSSSKSFSASVIPSQFIKENDGNFRRLCKDFKNIFMDKHKSKRQQEIEDIVSDSVGWDEDSIVQMIYESYDHFKNTDDIRSISNISSSSQETAISIVTTNAESNAQIYIKSTDDDWISTSLTSPSSLYAITTPPPTSCDLLEEWIRMKSMARNDSKNFIEHVEVHPFPGNISKTIAAVTPITDIASDQLKDSLTNLESLLNNNTSCSLSSTLTDSKTLDIRSPIVV